MTPVHDGQTIDLSQVGQDPNIGQAARLEATDQKFHQLQAMLSNQDGSLPDAEDSERVQGATIYFLVDGTNLQIHDDGRVLWLSYDPHTLVLTTLAEWTI